MRLAASTLPLVLVAALGAAPPLRAAEPLVWSSPDGAQRLTLGLATRFRSEWWDARASDTDSFTALRSRASVRYELGESVSAFAEGQDARLHGLSADTSGAGALYRAANGTQSQASAQRLRQAWLQVGPRDDLALRAGRQDVLLGTEVMYPEASWKYLKVARASQRLVGTVGWTHGERSNDGLSATWRRGDHHLFVFAARPTTGVFEIDSGYSQQNHIDYGGFSWTVRRGAWLRDTELRAFGIYYDDDRPTKDGGLSDEHDLEVYTAGFSLIGVRPSGPGALDYLLWGAYQWGHSPDPLAPASNLDHRAWAALVEIGYQCREARGKPWFRAGLNVASGDGSPTDGDQQGFFNLLPTNHLYYGFADQLAFSNLIDWFGQVKLQPAARTDVNLMLHQFQLFTSDDDRIFGTGAYSKSNFGYGRQASRGHRGVGTELDVVVSFKLSEHVRLEGGWSYLWGHAVLQNTSDDDVRFGYLQISASY